MLNQLREIIFDDAALKKVLKNNWYHVKNNKNSYIKKADCVVTILLIDIAIYLAGKNTESVLEILMPSINIEIFRKIIPELSLNTSTEIQNILIQMSTRPKLVMLYEIRHGYHLFNLLDDLEENERNKILLSIQDILPTIIQSTGELTSLLEILSLEQRNIVLEKMRPLLANMIDNALALDTTLKYLTESQQEMIAIEIKDRLSASRDFNTLFWCSFRYLNPDQQRIEIEAIGQSLLETIAGDCNKLYFLLRSLYPDNQSVVLKAIGEHWPLWVKTPNDFSSIICGLSSKNQRYALKIIGKKLPELEWNINSIEWMLRVLDVKNHARFLKFMENVLLRHLNNSIEVYHLFNYTSPSEHEYLLDTLQPIFPKIKWESIYIKLIFKMLANPYRSYFLKIAMDTICNTIIDSKDLINVLKKLRSGQRNSILDKIKDRLPDIVKDVINLSDLIGSRRIKYQQFTKILESIQERIPDIISTSSDLIKILHELKTNCGQSTKDIQRFILQAIQHKLPDLIESNSELCILLVFLTKSNRSIVIESINDRLSQLICNGDELSRIVMVLSAKQNDYLINAIKHKLPMLINNQNILETVLKKSGFDGKINTIKSIVGSDLCNDSNYSVAKRFLPESMQHKPAYRKPITAMRNALAFAFIIGLSSFFLVNSVWIALAITASSFALSKIKDLYEQYQYNKLNCSFYFQSKLVDDNQNLEVGSEYEAYKFGKDSNKSWCLYFKTFTSPPAYVHYGSFCVGRLAAEEPTLENGTTHLKNSMNF